MFHNFLIASLFCLVLFHKGQSQSSTRLATSPNHFQHPSKDKPSWQWLYLMQSATYYRVANEGMFDFNSCLLHTSQSLGLSSITVLAEGINDPETIAQSQWIDQKDPGMGIQMLSQLKGKKHLEQLLLLSAYYAFQPQQLYRKDSVAYFIFKAIEESKVLQEKRLERQALCLLGKMYFDVNEEKKADSIFGKLVKECKEVKDKETEAKALMYWGLFPNYDPATTPNRIDNFKQAAALYKSLKNKEGEIIALTDVGYMLVTINELQKAYDAFLLAHQLGVAIRYPYLHYNTDALAMVTGWMGEFGEPLKYSIQTIKLAETARDSIGWAYFYSRLGSIYLMDGNREEECLKWFLKALDRFVLVGDPSLYHNLFNITSIMRLLGRSKESLTLVAGVAKKVAPITPKDQIFYNLSFAECYVGIKEYNLAEQKTREADRIQQQHIILRSGHYRSLVNLMFGETYFSAGQLERSRNYYERYLADPQRMKLVGNDLNAIYHLIKIDSVFGDMASGLNHYKQYTQLLDSQFKVSKIRQAEELQVMYATEEKENQITLLNQRAKLEKANLRQATLVKNVTIGGIVVVLFIAALLLRQSRQRQITNRVITDKNDQLLHLLNEKEWLLKEIHHRVKNNLQVVMSLLNSQTAYIDNEPALTAIHDSQHRVHAMSLIHQKLYNSENVSSIDMSVYIRELVSYLADSFNAGQRIRLEYDIEPIQLDVSQAVPLGLILNEAITNALKYAFPANQGGVISIALSHIEPRRCLLVISDNGIGMPTHLDTQKTNSLGMSLMQGLSEDLEGQFSIENKNGTTIKVTFVHDMGVRKSAFTTASFSSGN